MGNMQRQYLQSASSLWHVTLVVVVVGVQKILSIFFFFGGVGKVDALVIRRRV